MSPADRRRVALVAGLVVPLAVGIAAWAWPLVGAGAGVAIAVAAGAGVGLLAYRFLAGQPPASAVREQRVVAADLPFAADLVAAALEAGAAPEIAARCVGSAVGGPLGDRLARVDRALRLGAPAAEAWAYLGPGPGVDRLVQAAARSEHSGAAFARSLHRVADDLRSDQLIAAEARARRAGVLIVLPLGLCFLPAFVLAGLVPVIVAVLGDVLSR